MSQFFEARVDAVTPIGALSLRRRRELRLGEAFLMSRILTPSEFALGRNGTAAGG